MYIHKLNGFFPKFWREMDELQRRQFLRSERFSDLLRAHRFEALQCGVAKVDAAVGGVGGCPFAGPGAWKWNTFEKTVGKHHIYQEFAYKFE